MNKKDIEQIKIARQYGLKPGTLKCEAFALLDEGYSPIEVRFLLRHHAGRTRSSFASTIRRYFSLWRASRDERSAKNL